MSAKPHRQWVSFEASSVALFAALTLSLAAGAAQRPAARQASLSAAHLASGATRAAQAHTPSMFSPASRTLLRQPASR